MFKFLCVISIILLKFNDSVFSQAISFEHLTHNDGLPSPTVTSIIKDSTGFMWFGTRRGLVRYDGYSYVVYNDIKSEKGEKITNFYFRKILQVNDSILLLVLNNKGFYSFNLKKERFTLILDHSESIDSEKWNTLYTLFVDREQLIWLGTKNGLVNYDLVRNSFIHYPLHKFDNFSGENPHTISSIVQSKDGNLWTFCSNGYLGIFNRSDKTFEFLSYSKNPLSSGILNLGGKLLVDAFDNLWIGTEYEGIYFYNKQKKHLTHYDVQNGKLPSNTILSLFEGHDNQLWAGTDGGGLLKFNREKNIFEIFKNNYLEPGSLSGNAVYTIYESNDQILWIGTYAAGINVYKKEKQKFNLLNTICQKGQRLNNRSVLCFAEAPNGEILVGTDGGGLNVLDTVNNSIKYITTKNSTLHSDIIKTLYFDKYGYLWIGSYGKGLCRYNYRNGLKRKSKVFLEGKGIWKIIGDHDGNIWIASLNTIYTIYLHKSGEIKSEPNIKLEAALGITNDMMLDSKGNIWVCTASAGLGYFETESKKYRNILTDISKPNSLPSNNITCIFEDNKGCFWIGSEFGGISKLLSFNKNEVKKIATYADYFNSAYGIVQDKENNLWISTDNGIVLLKNEKHFTLFGLDDGIQNKEFNVGSYFKAKNQKIYFGGIEGFNYFLPGDIKYNNHIPSVCLTEIKLFNKVLTAGEISSTGKVFMSKPLYLTDEITFDYSENIFSIGFSALDFTSPDKNKYKYKLEGFDSRWVSTDALNRYSTYTDLPYGDYVFHLVASNNDDVWNQEGVKLDIHILPPWWKTWWFKLITLIFGIASLLAFYFWRTYRIKKKNTELRILVSLKTEELKKVNDALTESNEEMKITNERLEEQNIEVIIKSDRIIEQQNKIVIQNEELNKLNETKDKFFSIIAHDLRNPVSAIHSLSELLFQNFKTFGEEEKEKFVGMMNQSASQLKKLTVDLLDWALSQTKRYDIKTTSVNVYELTGQTIGTILSQAQQKNILISNKTDAFHKALVDEKMLATIIRNIVSNAIKYSLKGTTVTITSHLTSDAMVKISIADQGIGMTEEQAKHLFKIENATSTPGTSNEKGNGLGLMICKEFILLNNGHVEIKSELTKGTTIDVFLPATENISETEKITDEEVDKMEKTELTISFLQEENSKINLYKRRKILIIDDEENTRRSLIGYLSSQFELYEAENGQLGLNLAQSVFPEIVICDLNMPVMNGFEFCHQLKKNPATSHIVCIILTGQNEPNTEKHAIEAGADEFLTKPYDSYILIKRIINQLETRDQVRKQFSTDTELNFRKIAKDKSSQEFIEKCVSYIESRISDSNLHADNVCKSVGLSKTLLYEKVKNITGLTVNEFIKVIRLKRSVDYLREGKLSISQIAIEVGFNSLSYFTKSFTKRYGKSPSEYNK